MSVRLRDLHDATFRELRFDWATATATLHFQHALGPVQVCVTRCTDVIIPRHEEWGHSVSVMSASFVDGDPARGLIVEMQTGDRIRVDGVCLGEQE